jgi:beta-lactamase regulating signal transducer with metallopeptidase domain
MSGDLLHAIVSWFSRPAVESLGWSLVHFLWQGAAVALPLAVLLSALRGATAGTRYLTACAGLLVMAACLLGTLAWSWSHAAVPPPGAERPSAERSSADRLDVPGQIDRSPEPTPPRQIPGAPAAGQETAAAPSPPAPEPAPIRPGPGTVRPLLPWFVAAWLFGVAVLSARLCAGWLWIQRLRRRRARPVAAEWEARLRRIAERVRVSRPVRLLESALVEIPSVIGWLRPVILLPASSLIGLSPRHLEAILAHELAHVRRHDYLVNLVQTALETLLFYHPAVWWVSWIIRAEREACCDDIAAQVCGDPLEYARALASMEELRGCRPQLVVAAGGGPLLDRIRRLAGLPTPHANRSAWWVMAALAAGVFAMVAMNGPGGAQANDPPGNPIGQPGATADDWGPESGGFRCRLVAVVPGSNDESPDVTKTTASFARSGEVTFAVELKNVGDKPATLLGVRYGDSYPTAAGKLNTEFFAPHLFEFEFTDRAGQPLARPARTYLGSMLELSGASAHEIAPGKSLLVLLRPARFSPPMEYELPPGAYTALVRYHGPTESVAAEIRKHWPDKPQAKAWTGEVTSNPVAFTVAADARAPKPPDLQWGEAKNGLRAAVEFRPRRGARSPTDPPGTVPLNTTLDVVFHLKNVSGQPVSLVSETWRQEDQVTVTNEAGQEQKLGGAWYSGWPIMVRWTLRPGEVAELHAANLGVAADDAAAKKFEHPVGTTLVAKPGRYTFRYTVRLGSIQTKDAKGNVVIPGKQDWQGELVTGEAELTVRARTPADDARERARNFVGRVEFFGKDGKQISAGSFTARAAGARSDSAAAEIHAGALDIPDCSERPLTMTVRAPGYEEALFYDVQLKPNETRRLELTPAAPARFRLVSSADGKPVAGAKVRFFNKTSDNAGGGPYPMDGIRGPVWATSRADGTVVLDTLQRTDPYYAKLGAAVYFFYIEPPAGLAGRFLGGVKAGTDLGDVAVGPPLEVRGEVRGTPEELDRFAAEWDQPFEMRTANPAAAFPYAVSAKLETKRDGDKLTFHLTGLRHGKLRIVGNFGPRPHSVSHTYGRRDPKGTDVVVEIDLTESLTGLVITPAGRKLAAGDGQ